MTEQELDALVEHLRDHANKIPALWPDKAATAITTLRAQLADANARADRADAERAAQIEADAAKYGPRAEEGLLINLGLQVGDRVVRVTGHDKWSDRDIGAEYTFCINSDYRKGVQHLVKDGSGWTTMTENGVFRVIGRKPHDRPALDAAIRAAKVEAWKEAAKKATSFLVGDPANGVPLRSPMAHEIADAILALIEREGV